MSSTIRHQPRIAIVGGGPSGLCLGALLHKRGVPFTIYELRDQPSEAALSAPSSYLDLHEESGLAAVHACGLFEQFLPLTADCTEELIIINKNGKVTHANESGLGNRPEIARNSLTNLFFSMLPAGAVKWGHKLLSATRQDDGKIYLDFGVNSTAEYDFVVGADGAWSKTRLLLTDVKPHYGGIHILTLDILDAATRYPDLAAMVGGGSCFILDENKGIISHRGAKGSVRLYVSIRSDDETRIEGDECSLKETIVNDRSMFGTWDKQIRRLIAAGFDDETTTVSYINGMLQKPLYMLPVDHRWESQSGLALIGDAAHLMMPWAGEGVNLALWDSLDLAEAITKGWDQAHVQVQDDEASFQQIMLPLVAEFDEKMFVRSHKAAEQTWGNSKVLFAEDGAQGMADLMGKLMEQQHEEEVM